jgi:hypothetical protein
VRDGTVWLPHRCDDWFMLHKKSNKESGEATHASVKKEMAEPRMADVLIESPRHPPLPFKWELNLQSKSAQRALGWATPYCA